MILKPRYLWRGAYRFVRASANYQVTGALPYVPTPPLSILVRFKLASLPASGAEFRIVSTGSTTGVNTIWVGYFNNAGTYHLRTVSFQNPTADWAQNNVGALTTGVWYTGCGKVTTNASRTSAFNGGNFVAANTTSITVTAQDRYGIGMAAYNGGTADSNFDGDIADVAFYNIALGQDDYNRYHRGESPLTIHPEALTAYFPYFLGGKNPLHSANNNIYLLNSGAQQVDFRSQGTGGVAPWDAPPVLVGRNRIFVNDVTTSNTTVTPAAGSIIVAGSAPTVKQNILRQPTVGSVVVAGSAPTVVQNVLRQPTVGSVIVTGNAPTLVTNTLRQPAAGSVIVAGNAPAVVTGGNAVVNPNTGTIVVSGLAPTLVVNTIRQPTVGSVIVAGNAPTLGVDQTVNPTTGSVVVAGNAPTVSTTGHVTKTPDAGQIIVSGLTPTIINSGLLSAQQLAELYGGNIFSTRKKKKKKEKPSIDEMVFQISKSTDGKKEIIKALPKPIQEELPDPQLALVSDLINKIEDASARVQKKVEQIYRKRIDDDDEDDVFILLL